jgi:hypothetical protein
MPLSDDARCVATAMWIPNPYLKLVFRTPSRIHPRTLAGLEELVAAGIIAKEVVKLAAAETWDFAVIDRDKLAAIPKVSQKLLKSNSFPITKD